MQTGEVTLINSFFLASHTTLCVPLHNGCGNQRVRDLSAYTTYKIS